MPLPQERIHTIDDIYNLPEGERAELINGQIYYMAPPSTAHQRTLSFLHLEIGNHIRNNNGSFFRTISCIFFRDLIGRICRF